MAASISFTEEEIRELARKFKILAEPSRLMILRSLADKKKCVGAIVEETGLTQTNVSKQLKIMREGGIVDSERYGHFVYYKIIDKTAVKVCKTICKEKRKKKDPEKSR